MKKKVWAIRIGVLSLALLVTGGLIIAFAAQAGSSEDPLITLSYVEKVFKPSVLGMIDDAIAEVRNETASEIQPLITDYQKKIDQKLETFFGTVGNIADNAVFKAMVEAAVEERLGEIEVLPASGSAVFIEVQVKKGKTLKAAAGCEIVLRSGVSSFSNTGFIDVSSGGAEQKANAAAVKNHQYIALSSGSSVKATEDAMFLVRGDYTVE